LEADALLRFRIQRDDRLAIRVMADPTFRLGVFFRTP
jgi:hypothetical protein